VAVGLRTAAPALHFSCNDPYFTALQAIQQAIKLGYKRPGLVMSRQLDGQIDFRFSAGFWIGQQALPPAQRLPFFSFDDYTESLFRAWMAKEKPDVIVCIHREVRTWLETMKLQAPKNVGLIHLDLSDDLPGWAGIRQNNELVGMAAVDILVGQLHRNECGIPDFPKCVQIQGTWQSGETVRSATSA
jgi:LacI family transcriptional regulator